MVTASPTNRFHQVNRLLAVLDMSARLVADHVTPDAALAHACGLNDAEWLTLGQDAGHYLAGGPVADETVSDVLAHLEAMTAPVAADPFTGLPL
jgi:hypothetical protein